MTDKVSAHNQIETLHRALPLVMNRSVAVDGGANVGDWACVMAEVFAEVHAFEPAADVYAILAARAPSNVVAHRAALWDQRARIEMRDAPKRPGRDRSRYCVAPKQGEGVDAITIDSLELPQCGLIKLDLEGAENVALRGARKTLARCAPIVIVEDGSHARRFGFEPGDVGRFLAYQGYSLVFAHGPDLVYRK